jgi:hypothetical protein
LRQPFDKLSALFSSVFIATADFLQGEPP